MASNSNTSGAPSGSYPSDWMQQSPFANAITGGTSGMPSTQTQPLTKKFGSSPYVYGGSYPTSVNGMSSGEHHQHQSNMGQPGVHGPTGGQPRSSQHQRSPSSPVVDLTGQDDEVQSGGMRPAPNTYSAPTQHTAATSAPPARSRPKQGLMAQAAMNASGLLPPVNPQLSSVANTPQLTPQQSGGKKKPAAKAKIPDQQPKSKITKKQKLAQEQAEKYAGLSQEEIFANVNSGTLEKKVEERQHQWKAPSPPRISSSVSSGLALPGQQVFPPPSTAAQGQDDDEEDLEEEEVVAPPKKKLGRPRKAQQVGVDGTPEPPKRRGRAPKKPQDTMLQDVLNKEHDTKQVVNSKFNEDGVRRATTSALSDPPLTDVADTAEIRVGLAEQEKMAPVQAGQEKPWYGDEAALDAPSDDELTAEEELARQDMLEAEDKEEKMRSLLDDVASTANRRNYRMSQTALLDQLNVPWDEQMGSRQAQDEHALQQLRDLTRQMTERNDQWLEQNGHGALKGLVKTTVRGLYEPDEVSRPVPDRSEVVNEDSVRMSFLNPEKAALAVQQLKYKKDSMTASIDLQRDGKIKLTVDAELDQKDITFEDIVKWDCANLVEEEEADPVVAEPSAHTNKQPANELSAQKKDAADKQNKHGRDASGKAAQEPLKKPEATQKCPKCNRSLTGGVCHNINCVKPSNKPDDSDDSDDVDGASHVPTPKGQKGNTSMSAGDKRKRNDAPPDSQSKKPRKAAATGNERALQGMEADDAPVSPTMTPNGSNGNSEKRKEPISLRQLAAMNEQAAAAAQGDPTMSKAGGASVPSTNGPNTSSGTRKAAKKPVVHKQTTKVRRNPTDRAAADTELSARLGEVLDSHSRPSADPHSAESHDAGVVAGNGTIGDVAHGDAGLTAEQQRDLELFGSFDDPMDEEPPLGSVMPSIERDDDEVMGDEAEAGHAPKPKPKGQRSNNLAARHGVQKNTKSKPKSQTLSKKLKRAGH